MEDGLKLIQIYKMNNKNSNKFQCQKCGKYFSKDEFRKACGLMSCYCKKCRGEK